MKPGSRSGTADHEPRAARVRVALVVATLFAAGFAAALHFARLGFMPLDQSIVFDGAWRLSLGQVPYRDFTTPSGLTPAVLQVPFFALLGATWLAYCVHAAVVNGLFCVLVYALLRRFDAPRWLAAAYALASGALLYPPIGTPYLEQHGFFFLMAAVVLLLYAARAPFGRRGPWLAALAGISLLLAFFSKQNVALYGTIPLAVALVLAPRGRRSTLRLAAAAAAGVAAGCAVLAIVAAIAGVSASAAADALLWLPLETGAGRAVRVDRILRSLFSLWSPLVAVAGAGAVAAVLGVGRLALPRARRSEAVRSALVACALALSLLATCALFLATTKNHPANGIPYVFAALGLVHAALRGFLPSRGRPLLEASCAGLLLALVAADVVAFHAEVLAPRVVNDVIFDPRLAATPATRELSFLRLQTPRRSGVRAAHLDRLIAFLRARDGAFFLLGDSSILYALTGRASPSPVLWFHPGLTLPTPGSAQFAAWDAAVERSLAANDVRYLVLEGPETWMRLRLADVPALARAAAERGVERTRFGPFTVIELRP